MTAHLIDLRQVRGATSGGGGVPELAACLTPLVGEPFRFARVSYGDELTLHFGDLTPARSPKLSKQPYGAYILGVRASGWQLKMGSEPVVVIAGSSGVHEQSLGKPLDNRELETGSYIQPGSRVLSALPFVVKPVEKFGLELRMSDGGMLVILPDADDAKEPDDDELPAIADWELIFPNGLLQAGPGLCWTFEKSR